MLERLALLVVVAYWVPVTLGRSILERGEYG